VSSVILKDKRCTWSY